MTLYYYIFLDKSKDTCIFHCLEFITVILSFLKKFCLEETFSYFFNIPKNLQENQIPKVVFSKDSVISLILLLKASYCAVISFGVLPDDLKFCLMVFIFRNVIPNNLKGNLFNFSFFDLRQENRTRSF